jgi:hypothetical protein
MANDIVHRGPAASEYAAMIVAFAVFSWLGFGIIVSMILAGVVNWYVGTARDPRGSRPWIE